VIRYFHFDVLVIKSSLPSRGSINLITLTLPKNKLAFVPCKKGNIKLYIQKQSKEALKINPLTKSYVFPTVIISGLFLLSKRFSHNVAMQKKVANLAKGISAVFTNPIMRSRFEWSFHKNRKLTNFSYFLANYIYYYTTPQCYFSWIIQGPLMIWTYHSLFSYFPFGPWL